MTRQRHPMTKLTDTEQVILTATSRNNGTVPTRERSKSKADPRAYGAAVASLLKKGILEFSGPAREGDFTKDGQKLALVTSEPAAKAPATSEPKEHKTREGTKQALVIEMLRRAEGASIAEIVEATGWLQHTARGVLAGSLKKKLGLTIGSEKDDTRGRIYKLGN
ncbi:MAG: hypothetical protein CFE32_16085 [Alphaproteobacteria bacterium PA3]|nr:MAG: hypothetical protein CFE32_16085 [Alphaproteobacteria bacterium PA3]